MGTLHGIGLLGHRCGVLPRLDPAHQMVLPPLPDRKNVSCDVDEAVWLHPTTVNTCSYPIYPVLSYVVFVLCPGLYFYCMECSYEMQNIFTVLYLQTINILFFDVAYNKCSVVFLFCLARTMI